MMLAKTVLLTSFLAPSLALVPTPSGFRQIGQTLKDSTSKSQFGANVELSDNGSRMVVASRESISIFQRDDPNGLEGIADATWETIPFTIPFDYKQGGLSLSGDGNLLAVRLQDQLDIFDINTGTNATITVCPEGKNVKLGKTRSTSTFGSVYWLLVSCEYFNNNKGKLAILQLETGSNTWIPVTTILGENAHALFGYTTEFNNNHEESPTIAVSSPFYQGRQGLVQVFAVSQDGVVTQQGSNLEGQAAGDKFGFSIAMSLSGQPQIVVGAPDCLNKHGCVSVFQWSDKLGWEQVGEVIRGENEGASFGRAVAISISGSRIAASSVRNNIVRLYHHNSNYLTPAGVLEGSARSQWGFDISLNDSGSMLVSGAIAERSVQVFVDETWTQSNSSMSSTALSSSPSAFPSSSSISTPSDLPSAPPSSSPSVSPSDAPSASPSQVPSTTISQPPSQVSSSSPSSSPSQGSSVSQSSFATSQPSMPSYLRSGNSTTFLPNLVSAGAVGFTVTLGIAVFFLNRHKKKKSKEISEECAEEGDEES